jgi:hypothetical protein
VGGFTYGVEVGVFGELEDVACDGAVGGVEASPAGAPERLQDVLDGVLGPRARQQREVPVPPQRRRAALPLHHLLVGRGFDSAPPLGPSRASRGRRG